MRHAADRPRWHALVQRIGPIILLPLLLAYGASMHVGFMAKDSSGPFFIIRMGAVGAGWLTPEATIQDIPRTAKVGIYQPTIPALWSFMFLDDMHGTRMYVPLWAPSVLVFGAMAWVRWAPRPRPMGPCPACGYDLEGCVVELCDHCGITAVTCPECGAKTPRVGAKLISYPPGAD
jgi:hypothetical protein